MTLKTRNRLQRATVSAAIVVFAGAWAAFVFGGDRKEIFGLIRHLPLAASQLVAIIAAMAIHRRFRKISAPEVFFVVTFLCTLAVEAVPPAIAQVSYFTGISSAFLSRAVYGFRWVGSFGLLVAGLYAIGIQYRQQEFVFLLITLIAFFLAFYLPVNGAAGEVDFASLGFGTEIRVFRYALLAAIAVNFLLAAFIHGDFNYLTLAISVILVIFAREALIEGVSGWFAYLVPAVLAIGLALASNRLYAVYMWS